jgi:hypothetical protein
MQLDETLIQKQLTSCDIPGREAADTGVQGGSARGGGHALGGGGGGVGAALVEAQRNSDAARQQVALQVQKYKYNAQDAQFTCFTRTNVQTLTQKILCRAC